MCRDTLVENRCSDSELLEFQRHEYSKHCSSSTRVPGYSRENIFDQRIYWNKYGFNNFLQFRDRKNLIYDEEPMFNKHWNLFWA